MRAYRSNTLRKPRPPTPEGNPMKSSGLFPRRPAAKGYRNRSGAGNSSGSGGPPFGKDGYEEGMLTERASSQAGGRSMAAKLEGRPTPNEHAGDGDGGCAYDRSMRPYIGKVLPQRPTGKL